jgi:hypothetical protein
MKPVSDINVNSKEEWDSNWKNRLSVTGFRNITMTGVGNGDLHIYEEVSLKYLRGNC